MNGLDSPFSVPVAFFAAWLGVVSVRSISAYKVRKLRSQERMAAIEKGMPLPEDPAEDAKSLYMEHSSSDSSRPPNLTRRIVNIRTAAIICIALGVGLILFFMALAHIVEERDVLCGAAAGLIPLAIGAGLLIDVGIQSRSQAQPAAPEPPAPQPPAHY